MWLLLIVAVLVVAIVVSRLTWASQLGERRSIKHHEQAMDVLRSVAGRPGDSEEPEATEARDHTGAHVRSSVDVATHFPEPAGGAAPGRREETIRILGREPSTVEPSTVEPSTIEPSTIESSVVEPSTVEPPVIEPPAVEPSVAEPAGVDMSATNATDTRPDDVVLEQPATPGSNRPPVGYDAATGSVLSHPPTTDEEHQTASSRSEARARSRARTRAMLWTRVQAPFVAAAHATSEAVDAARGRLAAHRAGSGVESGEKDVDSTKTGPEVVRAASAGTAKAVASVLRARQQEQPREASGLGFLRVRQADEQRGGLRVPRPGLLASVGTIVVLVGVTLGVLISTMSGSSHKVQQNTQAAAATQAPKPAATPPPAPPPPLKLVSSDPTGSVYNVTSTHLALSAVASGRVWLEVVAGTGPSGPVLFQGILTNGQTQQLANDAPVWIRIGAPGNLAMTINGTSVLLPSQTTQPYNLTFSTA